MSFLSFFVEFDKASIILLETVKLYYSYDCSYGYDLRHHILHMTILFCWKYGHLRGKAFPDCFNFDYNVISYSFQFRNISMCFVVAIECLIKLREFSFMLMAQFAFFWLDLGKLRIFVVQNTTSFLFANYDLSFRNWPRNLLIRIYNGNVHDAFLWCKSFNLLLNMYLNVWLLRHVYIFITYFVFRYFLHGCSGIFLASKRILVVRQVGYNPVINLSIVL